VGDQHVDATRLGGLHRIEDHRGGIGAGVLGDHRDVVALAPYLQLLHGGGPESVAGGEHDLLAFELQLLGQLADGGGLTNAIDANHQDHEGLLAGIDPQWLLHRLEQAGQLFLQRLVQRTAVGKFLARDATGKVLHDRRGGLDADVGGQQAGFQLVQQVVIDGLLAEEQAGHAFSDAGAGLGQTLLEAGKEAQLGRLFLCHGNRCRFDRDFRERRSFRHIHGFVALRDRLRLRLRLRCDFRLDLHFGDGLGLLGLDLGQLLSGLLVGVVGERLAVFQRLGWWRLGGRGLRLLAQPAEQAFLLAGLGRRLLIVVGTKHGEDFLKRAKRRRPCHRPDGGYPSTVQPTALNTTVGPNLFGQGCRGRINSALRSSWSRGCLTLGDYAPVIYRCRSIHAPLCPDHDAPVPCPRVFPPASTIRRDSFLNESFTMPPMLRRAAALLFAALYLPLVTAADIQPTHEFFLDNGLKVIVREDHRAPAVVSQLWYKVGSSYETPGQTGLSHALEHMMFKGSRKLGAGEASRILRELGAEENAFTSDDYTAYYQVLARDRLAVAFELEADRLASLKLPADEFAREIEVIKEERRLRTDDKPSSLAYERFKAMAYPASGYHTPTIGWMDDL